MALTGFGAELADETARAPYLVENRLMDFGHPDSTGRI
jgi:hypothetical protein